MIGFYICCPCVTDVKKVFKSWIVYKNFETKKKKKTQNKQIKANKQTTTTTTTKKHQENVFSVHAFCCKVTPWKHYMSICGKEFVFVKWQLQN